MIFAIKKYFRSKKNNSYQDELIQKLSQEHQKLFELVAKLEEAISNKNIKKIQKLVGSFKKELELHLLYEDTNLYEHLYLRYHYFDDIKQEIEKKHNEMKDIAKSVEKFIQTHQNLNEFEKFVDDFNMVKNVLINRVSFEEEILYDIYHNRYDSNVVLEKFKS